MSSQGEKEATFDLKCQYLSNSSIQVANKSLISEEVKFVNSVKEQVMRVELLKLVQSAQEQER